MRQLMLVAALFVSGSSIQAEEVSITDPRYQVANSPEGIERPKNGTSMAEVEAAFGTAEQTLPAVGEPPISRWVYPEFIVVFEHDKVIHSVVTRN